MSFFSPTIKAARGTQLGVTPPASSPPVHVPDDYRIPLSQLPLGLVLDTAGDATSPIAAPATPRNRSLRDWRSTYDYGIVGNGVADDTANLLLATEDCRNSGRKLYHPHGTCLVSGSIVNAANANPLSFEGFDPAISIIKQAAAFPANPIISVQGAGFGAVQAVANPAPSGSTVISGIASTAGWAQNDIILIRANDQGIFGNSAGPGVYGICAVYGEYAKIKTVDSPTQVTVYGRLEVSYTGGQTDIRKITTNSGRIAHLGFVNGAPGTQQTAARCLQFNFFNGVELVDLAFKDFDADQIQLQQGLDFRIDHPRFLQAHDLEPGGTNPYCIECSKAVHHGIINNLISRYGRHGFTTGAPSAVDVLPAHILVADANITEHSQSGLDVHPGGRKITFANPIVHNQYPGCPAIQLRGPECDVVEPIITQADIGVLFVFGADKGRVLGGRLKGTDIGIQFQDSDACVVDGGLLIDNPLTNGLYFHTHDVGWPPGSPTRFTSGNLMITGNPANGAIQFFAGIWASPGFRILPQTLIPDADATHSIVGMTEPQLATAATLTVPV